jgi:hypothetical protein
MSLRRGPLQHRTAPQLLHRPGCFVRRIRQEEAAAPPSWGPVRGTFLHATPAPEFAAEEISESAPVPVKKIFVNFQRQLLVVGQFCVRYCFADSAHADAFRDRFGGERLNTRPGFASYKMKDRCVESPILEDRS